MLNMLLNMLIFSFTVRFKKKRKSNIIHNLEERNVWDKNIFLATVFVLSPLDIGSQGNSHGF